VAVRTFLFCDICNPLAIRSVELRRHRPRADGSGQRLTDGRAWFEGELAVAVASHGWIVTADGQHVCPKCAERHPELR
jgi:hypothetical protein